MMMGAFRVGDGSMDFSDECAMCWAEPATGTVFIRFSSAMKLHFPPVNPAGVSGPHHRTDRALAV